MVVRLHSGRKIRAAVSQHAVVDANNYAVGAYVLRSLALWIRGPPPIDFARSSIPAFQFRITCTLQLFFTLQSDPRIQRLHCSTDFGGILVQDS